MTRILVADGHEVVRIGLRKLFQTIPSWLIVAEVREGRHAISAATETKPDVVVLDYALPDMKGSEVTAQIRAQLPKTEVLIYTSFDSDLIVQEVLKAGARGYLLKSDAEHSLIEAVQSLAVHRPFLTSRVSESMLLRFLTGPDQRESPLTNRERDVLRLVAEGKATREIANILNISQRTVESYRAASRRKLNLTSKAALVRYAIRNDLLKP